MTAKPLPDLDPTQGYLMSLTLENIRCFGSPAETMSLTKTGSDTIPARWTVILGANGVGKTTVLRALTRYRLVEFASSEDNVRQLLTRNREVQSRISMTDSRSHQFKWQNQEASNDGEDTHWTGPQLTDPSLDHPIPQISGYAANRNWSQENGRASSIGTLFDRKAHVRDPSQTLANWTAFEVSNPNPANSIVSNLKNAFRTILPDVTAVKLDFDSEKRPFASFQTPNGWIALDDMSWGYQVFAAFAADYASRLIDWYPDSKTPLNEPGICLVDELDLHMHPSWQRKVIDDLSNIFPATQFIVTVHSPLVVQAAEDANLVVLKRYQDDPTGVQIDNDVEAIKGWRIDQVLTSDLFGLESSRPPSDAKALNERAYLLAKNAPTPQEQARLDTLEAQAMALPSPEANWEDEARALVLRAAERLKSGA